jgi:hypothetical protein
MLKSLVPILALTTVLAVAPATLPTPDPDDGGIVLPPGFRALVVADNLVGIEAIFHGADGARQLERSRPS